MNKIQSIKAVEQQIKQQEFIMVRIKSLINGKNTNEPADIYARDENFRSTIMKPENKFLELMGGTFYDEIINYYEQWFGDCKKIYSILFKDPQNLKKTKLNSLASADLDVLQSKFDDLTESHKMLNDYLNTSLQRLNALNDSKSLLFNGLNSKIIHLLLIPELSA